MDARDKPAEGLLMHDDLGMLRAAGGTRLVLGPAKPDPSAAHEEREALHSTTVMAGLDAAIHVFDGATLLRRGCPGQARA